MKKFKFMFSLLAITALNACVTSSNLSQTTLLNEGILITKMSCDRGGGVNIYKTGGNSKGFFNTFKRDALLFCPINKPSIATVKLEEGDYFFGGIGGGPNTVHVDEDKAYKFTIRSNTLNYIGDVHIHATPFKSTGGKNVSFVKLSITDNNSNTLEDLKDKYPRLLEKYQYRKDMAKR